METSLNSLLVKDGKLCLNVKIIAISYTNQLINQSAISVMWIIEKNPNSRN